MRRPRHFGLLAAALAFVVLLAVGIVVTVSVVDRQNAIAEHGDAASTLTSTLELSEAAVAEADQVLAVAADPLLDPEAVAALTTERDAAAQDLADAAEALRADPGSLDTDAVRALTDDIRSVTQRVHGDDATVFSSLGTLVTDTAAAATEVDSANFDAENQPRIEFRRAVAELAQEVGDDTAEPLLAYLEAAHALESSHAEEIAEKSGPLLDRRLTVEKFARSISGGVLLDFDWARTVNGYGTGGSYGGTSYWSASDGGYATITLSDSVATMWPGAGVQSLVVHEVGHAVLARDDCNTLFFDSEFAADGEEPWATAWAIGRGYTAEGNGESIYGAPPGALVEMSAECR
jgi:hypothetical protein